MTDPDGYSLGWAVALAALAAAPVQIVIATQYLSVAAAQRALFPQSDLFSELGVSLNAAQRGQLRVQTDIKNIAGATLSCEHVTAGVRWLVALWQVALRPAAASG